MANSCELCDGTGWRRVPGKINTARRCECRQMSCEHRVRTALRGLGERYFSAQLGAFDQRVRGAVEDFLRSPQDGLLLLGPTGTGKSYLLAATVRRAIELGREVTLRRCADIFSEIRSSYAGFETTELAILQRYAEAQMLGLDDLGAGSLSDMERRTMLDLLDQRLNRVRPTIVTTNLSLGEISERIDARIGSRLKSLMPIVLGGADLRGKRR